MEMKKRKYITMAIMVMLSVFLAYLQFVQAGCNSDDAATYAYMYNFFELGNKSLSIKDFLDPWFYSSAIAYLLNVGGSGTFSSLAYLSVWYGIAVFFTLLMTMNKRDSKWMLALAVFILLPYRQTNKYHMVAAFVTLFSIWALQCYKDTGKKWILCAVGLIAVYSFVFTDDRLLLLVFLFATLIVYLVIFLFQDKSKRKYIYMAVFGGILVAGVLNCVNKIAVKILGQETGILGVLGGYGGADYFNWIDVETFFLKGIPSIIGSIFVQWNIPIRGGMVQINSIYWFIRIIIVCLALAALFDRWKVIIKKGIKSVELLDALSVVCTTVALGVNALNGMVQYYSVTSAPMNRYASVCWFLLVVILVRWMDERLENVMIYPNISNNLFLGGILILLTIGYINPIFAPAEDIVNSSYAVELDYLKSHGEMYRYGLGSYWKSNPITAATNAEYVICSGTIQDDELVCSKKDGFYTDGGNYFNFIVSDAGSEMSVSPENIENVRGDYTDIYSNGDTIYMYDYDIRFDTAIIMDTAGMGYELTDTIVYNIDLPIGTSRIEVTTTAKDNLLLAVVDNPDITDIRIGSKGDDIATAEVTCLQNTQIGFSVGRREDILTELYKVEVKRVAGAVYVDAEQTTLPLNEGRYIVTFSGENLKDMEVNWKVDGEVTQLTNGRIKRRYQVNVSERQNVEYELISNGAMVDSVYYENEDLFGKISE
ncbi:MAG: hypothetical protein K2N73_17520 [Lachnospiraceae bacterium]|nr:hypothetical protein [Lachnospiraceae bacterium]